MADRMRAPHERAEPEPLEARHEILLALRHGDAQSVIASGAELDRTAASGGLAPIGGPPRRL
eukprot:7734790-Pyramimonas_sp.AAC.1